MTKQQHKQSENMGNRDQYDHSKRFNLPVL